LKCLIFGCSCCFAFCKIGCQLSDDCDLIDGVNPGKKLITLLRNNNKYVKEINSKKIQNKYIWDKKIVSKIE
jgi:hypothetical protein